MNTNEEIYKYITQEELLEMENMAGLFFSTEQICIAMGWDAEILEYFNIAIEMMDTLDLLYSHYFKGRISAEIELRQSIKQAARNGSNPAQLAMLDFHKDSRS